MAIEKSGHSSRAMRGRQWGVALAVLLASASAQAETQQPHEVVVTPDTRYASAINEDGVIEANVARVEDGVVYLEYRAARDAGTALTAAGH